MKLASQKKIFLKLLCTVGLAAICCLCWLTIARSREVEKNIRDLKKGQSPSQAAQRLGDLKDRRAVEPLITTLLKDEDKFARLKAAEALGKIKDPRAVGALLAAIKDCQRYFDVEVDWSIAAADALAKIGSPAVNPLLEVLKHDDNAMRYMATVVLAKIKDPRAVVPLIAALKDDNPEVRQAAAFVLGKIKDRRALDPLIAAMNDIDERVKLVVAVELAEGFMDVRATELLITALTDKDSGHRFHAAHALGEIKDSRAIEPLKKVLEDDDADVRKVATEALAKINARVAK